MFVSCNEFHVSEAQRTEICWTNYPCAKHIGIARETEDEAISRNKSFIKL